MKFTHHVETPFVESFRTKKILGLFDVPEKATLSKTWEVDLPVEDFDWEIGLIVGSSGSGKTTLSKRAFGEDAYFTGLEWSPTKALVDDFPKGMGASEITDVLSHVGLSSPPAWLQPFHTLSNGQKFRAELARALIESEGLLVFDEFTSVVDRNAARFGSYAVSKFIRRHNQANESKKQFVAVSCHSDINDWLEPDWVYEVDTGTFTRGRLRRPRIELQIFRCHHAAWRLFAGHHYLTADLKKQAHCYLAYWEDEPVGFVGSLNMPHPRVKGMYREHRAVVLPDYQGAGIGNRMSEAVAEIYHQQGRRYSSVTSHPAMIAHRLRSPKWIATRLPGSTPAKGKGAKLSGQSSERMTTTFEYVGDDA